MGMYTFLYVNSQNSSINIFLILFTLKRFREEAERRKQQQIENERRQREEMEKEQEAMRKKMAEQRLVSFLVQFTKFYY